jgi:hypothetical protein
MKEKTIKSEHGCTGSDMTLTGIENVVVKEEQMQNKKRKRGATAPIARRRLLRILDMYGATEEEFEQVLVHTGSRGAALAQLRLEFLRRANGRNHNEDDAGNNDVGNNDDDDDDDDDDGDDDDDDDDDGDDDDDDDTDSCRRHRLLNMLDVYGVTEEEFEQVIVRTGSRGAALSLVRLQALRRVYGTNHNDASSSS